MLREETPIGVGRDLDQLAYGLRREILTNHHRANRRRRQGCPALAWPSFALSLLPIDAIARFLATDGSARRYYSIGKSSVISCPNGLTPWIATYSCTTPR